MSNKPWVGKGVVIVDDSRQVRVTLRTAFEGCGMHVLAEADTGVVGLAMVKQHKPELVSLDMIMPEMDGVECYKKLQAYDPTLKIVMVSWLANEPKILENLKDLIPSHLFQAKPVSAIDLAARLEKIYFPNTLKLAAKPGDEPKADFDGLDDLGIKVS